MVALGVKLESVGVKLESVEFYLFSPLCTNLSPQNIIKVHVSDGLGPPGLTFWRRQSSYTLESGSTDK